MPAKKTTSRTPRRPTPDRPRDELPTESRLSRGHRADREMNTRLHRVTQRAQVNRVAPSIRGAWPLGQCSFRVLAEFRPVRPAQPERAPGARRLGAASGPLLCDRKRLACTAPELWRTKVRLRRCRPCSEARGFSPCQRANLLVTLANGRQQQTAWPTGAEHGRQSLGQRAASDSASTAPRSLPLSVSEIRQQQQQDSR